MGFKATNNAKDEEAFASTFFEFKFDLHKNLKEL